MWKFLRNTIFSMSFVLGIPMVFLLISCQGTSPTEEAAKDPVEGAYALIDQGEYSAAISQLEDLQKSDLRVKVRIALASAYAARAGIKVENYWGFVVGFQVPLLTLESIPDSRGLERVKNILNQFGEQKPKELHSEQLIKFVQALNEYEMIKQRIESIPTVGKDSASDLRRAMEILSKENVRAAKTYRAILGLVLVKTSIEKGFDRWDAVIAGLEKLDFERPNSKKNKEIICDVPIKTFMSWFSGLLGDTQGVLQDLAVSFPARTEELLGSVSQLKNLDFGQYEESRCH